MKSHTPTNKRFVYHLPIIVTGAPNRAAALRAARIIAQEARSGIEYGIEALDFLPNEATVDAGQPLAATGRRLVERPVLLAAVDRLNTLDAAGRATEADLRRRDRLRRTLEA